MVYALSDSRICAAEVHALQPSGKLFAGIKGKTTATASLKKRVNTQNHINFEFHTNTKVVLTITALVHDAGKLQHFTSPKIVLSKSDNGTVDLLVNNLFPLGDASYRFDSLIFTLHGKKGSSAEITKLRTGLLGDLSEQERETVVTSSFRCPKPRQIRGLNPVKVYFEFDNNDNAKTIRNWPSKKYIPDPNPSGGFRTLLLEHTDGIITITNNPTEADVIVYARAKAGVSSKVVEAVKSGKRLIIYGQPADPEIATLATIKLESLQENGFPKRQSLKLLRPKHEIFKDEQLLQTDYGQYYQGKLSCGSTILAFANGEPAIAEKDNILHCAIGLGSAILSPGIFYDRTFLKMVCRNNPAALNALKKRNTEDTAKENRRKKELVTKIIGKENNPENYNLGMSDRNFGRFGWLVSDGLFVGGIKRDLSFFNRQQFFRFDDSGKITASLHNWKRKSLSGNIKYDKSENNVSDPESKWTGRGKVQYTAEITFNPKWKNKEIFFVVDKGIDDVDETSLNGKIIGKTTTKTPNYWKCTRYYKIDPSLIKWNQRNKFSIVVENLRDAAGLGSPPYLLIKHIRKDSPEQLCITEIDWVHKSYRKTYKGNTHELDTTLLSPFILNKFSHNRTHMALEEKTAQYAAFSTDRGIRIVNLYKRPDFYSLKRDGKWNSPWLLLFRKNWRSARPLLLVFERQMSSLTATLNGRFISGISINAGNSSIGYISCGWPWGCTPVNASGWIKGLPPKVLAKIRLGVNFAFNFPIGCDEAFRIDNQKQRIEIVNRFRYKKIKDEWNTPTVDIATLPPLVAFAIQQKSYVLSSSTPLENFSINGEHGPLMGRRNSNTIRYYLPIPARNDIMLIDVKGESKWHKRLNDYFKSGVKWSRGGHVPCKSFTPEYPEGKKFDPETLTIPLQSWMYKLCSSMQGYLCLDHSNRTKLINRVRDRLMKPFEQFQYKACYEHRIEPFSGIRYPIHFNHCTRNHTPYAPGLGSSVIFGDCGEGSAVIAWAARQLADSMGQRNWIRNNWSFFKYAMRYSMVIDDYAFHASTCREFGGGAYIDMLNAEYAAMLYYALVAEGAGDNELYKQLMYRAAKRGIPTLMRLYFLEYVKKAMPDTGLEHVAICTGFSEDHLPLLRLPTKNKNFLEANDLFDLSQGYPGVLHFLYTRYSLAKIEKYVNDMALPLMIQKKNMLTGYIQPMVLYANKKIPVGPIIKNVLKRKHRVLTQDCPGMKVNYLIGLYLSRKHDWVMIRQFQDLKFLQGTYDPQKSCVTLNVKAGPHAMLSFSANKKFKSVNIDGSPYAEPSIGNTLKLKLKKGQHMINILY